MRYQGKVTSWKDGQDFGFITPNGGGSRVFVHIKSFASRQRRPLENEIVTYELRTDGKGRAQAERVAFVDKRAPSSTSSEPGALPILSAAGFLVLVAVLSLVGKLPFAVSGFYIVASIVAFAAYARDKSAAKKSHWRTKENTLHVLALIGGWPGALTAQRLLRHKSKKRSFQIVFWLTVMMNCGALGWLLSPSGAGMLRAVSGAA